MSGAKPLSRKQMADLTARGSAREEWSEEEAAGGEIRVKDKKKCFEPTRGGRNSGGESCLEN